MATSKTLTPTNVTISIPAMTDSPDASVFSNCVDKEADAINSLNSNISSYWLGNVSNLSALGTAIMSYASSISTNKEYAVSFGANADTDYWTSAVVYYGTLYKYSNTTFAASFVGTNGTTFTIATFNSGSSYSHTSSKELNSNLSNKFKLVSSGSLHDLAGQTGIFWLTSGVSDKPEPGGGTLTLFSYNATYCAGTYVVADNGKLYTVCLASNTWTYKQVAFAS